MSSVYKTIIERAEAVKARKKADYQALMSRVYRDGELVTSQFSSDDHQTSVDDYGGKIQDSLQTRDTEREGLKLADSKIARPLSVYSPVDQEPNKYTHLKKCTHPDHEGDRWVNRSQFCADKRMADGLQSYCKACDARRKKLAYVPRWRRGV